MEQDALIDEMLQKKLDLALQVHTKQINETVKDLHNKVDHLSFELAELKRKVKYGELDPVQAPKQAPQKTIQAPKKEKKEASKSETKHPTNDTDFDVSIEKHFYCGQK